MDELATHPGPQASSIRAYADEEVRQEPEMSRVIAWIDQEVDRLHALLAKAEDALSGILAPEGAEERGMDAARSVYVTPVGQALSSHAYRIDAANDRLQRLLDRARVGL